MAGAADVFWTTNALDTHFRVHGAMLWLAEYELGMEGVAKNYIMVLFGQYNSAFFPVDVFVESDCIWQKKMLNLNLTTSPKKRTVKVSLCTSCMKIPQRNETRKSKQRERWLHFCPCGFPNRELCRKAPCFRCIWHSSLENGHRFRKSCPCECHACQQD